MRLLIKNKQKYFLEFVKLGFITKQAFIYICLDIDNAIDIYAVNLLWDLDVLTLEMDAKMNHILETLKNE